MTNPPSGFTGRLGCGRRGFFCRPGLAFVVAARFFLARFRFAAFRRALGVNPFLRERYGLIPALEKELGEKPI